jgi:arylsulfatase A-like enzyme
VGLTRWVASAGWGALLGTLATAIGLAQAGVVAPRLRDVLLFDGLRRVFGRIGMEILDGMPTWASLPLGRDRGLEAAAFVGQVLWLQLALASALAIGLALLLSVLPGRRRASVLPLAVLVAVAAAPGCYVLGQAWIQSNQTLPYYAAAVVLSALVGSASALLLRAGRAGRGLFAALGLGTWLLAAAAVPLLGGLLAPPELPGLASSPNRPSILLVSIDSLRADHLGAYGYERETSPVFDRLAAEGVLFENASAASSWTLPSHITLLTGLAPEGHGVFETSRRLGLDAVTLPEVLKGAGYSTAGFVSGPYLESRYGYTQGFDVYDDFTLVADSNVASHRGITSPALTARVLDWLTGWDEGGREQPFFLFVHMWDVHYDFNPPAPYDTMFDPDYEGEITGDDFEVGGAVHVGMAARDLAHVIALYDGEIRFTDEHLGRIVERLRELGTLDETIVVVTSDHGEEFFEHREKGHRNNLYEETIRVPLTIRYPERISAGAHIERPVQGMDVAPTILGLAGIARPEGFGQRGVALLEEGAPERPAFSHLGGAFEAVRTRDHKLIRRLDGSGSGSEEFYDLREDPGETTNRLASQPEAAEALRKELRRWREESGSGFSGATEIDAEHLERLRALGYVE